METPAEKSPVAGPPSPPADPPGWVRALRRMKRFVVLARNCFYDFRRYDRFCLKGGLPYEDAHVEARLTAAYHTVEKGLALRDMRPGFGKAAIAEIGQLLDTWRARGLPRSHRAYGGAVATLGEYVRIHKALEHPVPHVEAVLERHPKAQAGEAPSSAEPGSCGGVREVTREAILAGGQGAFQEVAFSRFSVRDFSDEPVDLEKIRRAIRAAQRSPSVCNRQTSRVHVITDKALMQTALACQNGNRGFNNRIDKTLIVTADLREFFDPEERNQGWIDGGMFAMSLLYGLHAEGLGACPLNWSARRERDIALRAVFPLQPYESVIMFIAVGNLPEGLRVAVSARKPLESIVTMH